MPWLPVVWLQAANKRGARTTVPRTNGLFHRLAINKRPSFSRRLVPRICGKNETLSGKKMAKGLLWQTE